MRSFTTLSILALFLCGCSVLGPREQGPRTYYVIEPAACSSDTAHTPHPYTLLISDTSASRLINSQRILFSRDSATRGLYQFAFWLESPALRFANLILQRLECARLFRTQTRNTTLARADFILNTELLDFYHDVSASPSFVRVDLRAELLDLKSREIRASRSFVRSLKLQQADAPHAVDGFTRATDEILNEMLLWLGEQLPEN